MAAVLPAIADVVLWMDHVCPRNHFQIRRQTEIRHVVLGTILEEEVEVHLVGLEKQMKRTWLVPVLACECATRCLSQ